MQLPSQLSLVAALAAASLLALGLLLRGEASRRRATEIEARRHDRQLRSLTGALRESVTAYDLDLKLQFVNPAFETLTGFTVGELRERNFIDYTHPDDRLNVTAEREGLARGGVPVDQEYRIITKDGRERWVSSTWQVMRDDAGAPVGYLGTELDITEKKRGQERLREDAELFQAVMEVEQAVAAAGLDSSTVMRVIAERSMALTGAGNAIVEMIDGEDAVPRVSIAGDAPTLKLRGSLSGVCAMTGEMQRTDDAANDPRVDRAAALKYNMRSIVAVPLKAEGRVLGVLKVTSSDPYAFRPRDTRALELLAGMMGSAVSHASAFEGRQTRLEERTRALQESEQRFKQLVDAAQEGIWVIDDRGATTYANQRMADLLGHAHGELNGRPIFDFVDPSARGEAQRLLANTGVSRTIRDLRFRRRDGTELWATIAINPIVGRDGEFVGTVAMLSDVTERKHAEDRVRRTAERLRALHELDQAVLAADSPADVGAAALQHLRRLVPCQRCTVVLYDFAAETALMVAGYAGDAPLAGETFALADFSPPATLQRGTIREVHDVAALADRPAVLERVIAHGVRSMLSVPLRVDGETIGELNIGAGQPGPLAAEYREIALEVATPLAMAIQQARLREQVARHTVELERRVAERTAELREANAELEAFSYSVSHDLRAPIRHIGGFAQLLIDEHSERLDATGRHYAERIRNGARDMAALVDDLLNLARVARQDVVRRRTDLTAMVHDLRDEIGIHSPGRAIEWDVEPLPAVDADPALLRVALGNLLSNAVKFTAPREHAKIRVYAVEAEGQSGLAVADNGVGFGMAHADRLFGVFERLHHSDEFEGTGVGLAIVRRIAQKHGGRAWAEGEPGHGATFFLTVGDAAIG
ncbi:MAG: PAS domain S-box protein [Gemmatimonadota bacterium]